MYLCLSSVCVLFYISMFCTLRIGIKVSKFQTFPAKASASLPAKTVFVCLHLLHYSPWSESQYKVTAIACDNVCLRRSLAAHVRTSLLSIWVIYHQMDCIITGPSTGPKCIKKMTFLSSLKRRWLKMIR